VRAAAHVLAAALAAAALSQRAPAAPVTAPAPGAPAARAAPPIATEPSIAALLSAAVPADGTTDVVLVDMPWTARAPRVRVATPIGAAPAAVKDVLLDPAHYRAVIPGLVRAESSPAPGGAIALEWELEVPLVNLSGKLTVRARADGVDFDLTGGDLAPGRIAFTIFPRPGGCTLVADAQLDIENSSWLLRRIMARSPVGQPAALIASAYVALRAVALRAEHVGDARAWRPGAPMAPTAAWRPDARLLGAPALGSLRGRGPLGLVARAPSQRLEGVAMVVGIGKPIAFVSARLRDPDSWHAFPGWHTVRPQPGPFGRGAEVEDNLPLADFDATWIAEPGPLPRWTARAGETRGARLGWEIFPGGLSGGTLAALVLYPRLETTGRLARRSIASEPLLEHGMAVALAFADATAMKHALEAAQGP
jgi:hypothetical protein